MNRKIGAAGVCVCVWGGGVSEIIKKKQIHVISFGNKHNCGYLQRCE